MENLDYGIVGNCKSAALVSKSGSIDWCCLPQFDSSSVFGKILDEEKGGSFEIMVDEEYEIFQDYIPKTNILVTRFTKGINSFEVIDFMPRYRDRDLKMYTPPDIIRFIKHLSGKPVFRINYNPRLEYAKPKTNTSNREKYIKSNTNKGDYDSLYLYTDSNKDDVLSGKDIILENDTFFLISYNQKLLKQTTERAYLKLERTKVYWLNWSERTRSFTKYNKEALRSALALKLLSFDKTGAVLAAATTSLPETIGEVRNWDYRFCWIRDASMVIKVMTELNHTNVAKRYLNFIIDIIPDKDEKIQIMYGINGQKKLTEKSLTHLSGYKNSSPVRIGNDAYRQKQNDIYGILMDVLYQQFKVFDTTIENGEDLWTIVRSIVHIVGKNWKKPDRGIWEFRADPRHFTFSKLLCWVAIDRGIKIANMIRRPDYAEKWKVLRNKIREDIEANAWNESIQAYVQSYGSKELDASTLLMEQFGFIAANNPRYISTVRATEKHLTRNGLMYRYKNEDDFGLPSSSFTICTFWLINSLYKIGDKQKAINLFDQILSYRNHVGLFSEDIDFDTKRLLGNFPQAYSHLALIETAITLADGNITSEDKILEAIH